MRLTVEVPMTVHLADGSSHYVGKLGPAELIAFERHFGIPSGQLAGEQRIEWFVFLAYAGLKNRDVLSGTFDDFLKSLSDVDIEDAKSGEDGQGKAPEVPTPSSDVSP